MGKPKNTRYTQKYPKYPEIPERKKIPGNTRSTLLPDPNPTRYPVFCPIPRPDIEKPYPLGTVHHNIFRKSGMSRPTETNTICHHIVGNVKTHWIQCITIFFRKSWMSWTTESNTICNHINRNVKTHWIKYNFQSHSQECQDILNQI